MLLYLVFMVVFLKASPAFSSEPQIIPFTLPADLVQGGKVKAMCSVSKGSHPIKFEWLFNGHNLYETNDQFVQNLDDASILNIKNLQLIHNSNISCVATNRFGKDVHTALLVVNAAPQWVKKAPELVKAKENEPVQLDCLVNGNPSPRISWTKSLTKNSKEQPQQGQPLKSFPNGTLQLDSVQKSDEGEFVCTVDNKIGEKLVSRTQLEVQTPARVSMIDNRGKELVASDAGELPVNYARKGEEFSIRCKAIGDQPLTIDWWKNHELMQYKFSSNMETLSSLSPSGLISELHWRSIERSDSADYECSVKNSLGESRMGQKLVVLEPPEAPKNVKISDLDANSVKVSWQLGYTGNLELTKIIVYYWESKSKRQTSGNHKLNKIEIDLLSSTWHVLKQLKSGTVYQVAVTCANSVGESAFSAPIEFETKMKNPIMKPDLTIRKVFGNKIEIAWKYPLQERRSANVTGFQVFYKPIDEQNYFIERVTVDNEIEPATEEMHLTLVNLKKSTKYLIKVKAYNKEGYSPDSDEIECTTLRGNVPSAPRIVQHQVHSKSYLIVKWEHSNSPTNLNAALRHEEPNSPANEHQHQLVPKTSDDGNLQDFDSAVQFFMAYVEVSSLRMVVQTIPIPASVRQVTITNLDQDIQYNIYLTATNSYGESEYSEPLLLTIRSYQYEMSLFMAERNALVITAVSIGATCIVVSIICSIIYIKKFQLAQQEKIRKMSTLTLSKCGTNKTTATYATIGNGTNAQFANYTAQQMTPTSAAYQQPSTSAYQEIGLTYDRYDLATGGLATGGLATSGLKSVTQTPHHLTTFGHVTLSSDRSSDTEDLHALQIKDRFRQSNKSLDSMKNMRINYDECIYDDALG